jgi:hypothetical protein
VRGEEITVIVLLVGRRDIVLALGQLLKPAVLVFIAQIEPLHIVGGDELTARAKVRGFRRIEYEVRRAVALHHRVEIGDIRVG